MFAESKFGTQCWYSVGSVVSDQSFDFITKFYSVFENFHKYRDENEVIVIMKSESNAYPTVQLWGRKLSFGPS